MKIADKENKISLKQGKYKVYLTFSTEEIKIKELKNLLIDEMAKQVLTEYNRLNKS